MVPPLSKWGGNIPPYEKHGLYLDIHTRKILHMSFNMHNTCNMHVQHACPILHCDCQ